MMDLSMLVSVYQDKFESIYPYQLRIDMSLEFPMINEGNFLIPPDESAIIEIERLLTKNEPKLALAKWNQHYFVEQNFVLDTVLLGIYQQINDFENALKIKIHWQKTMDKLVEIKGIQFYKALHFLYLGNILYKMNEFEAASNYFQKATIRFRGLFSDNEFIGSRYCQFLIIQSYNALGARGEARYHIREIIEKFDLSKDEKVNYSWQLYKSYQFSNNRLKTEEYAEKLKIMLSQISDHQYDHFSKLLLEDNL